MLTPEFLETVNYNCDVSDAQYWGYFSICTLLLRLREFFKVEKNLAPWDRINNEEIIPWIDKKESIWKELENKCLITVKINGKSYSPFNVNEINNIIVNDGFVYGAGYALFMKPSFFVGRIKNHEKIEGYDVYFIEKELARDLFSSPGMSIGKTIFIRITDIKFRIWDAVQNWFNKKTKIYEFILSRYQHPSTWSYPYENFYNIVDKYCKIVLYHELSEQEEAISEWGEIIKNCNNSKTEHILRGIQDLIADFSEKGPLNRAIIEKDKELLCLYLVGQKPYQKKMLTNTIAQIEKALENENWEKINNLRIAQFKKWKNNYINIIEIFKSKGLKEVKNLTNQIFEGGLN